MAVAVAVAVAIARGKGGCTSLSWQEKFKKWFLFNASFAFVKCTKESREKKNVHYNYKNMNEQQIIHATTISINNNKTLKTKKKNNKQTNNV